MNHYLKLTGNTKVIIESLPVFKCSDISDTASFGFKYKLTSGQVNLAKTINEMRNANYHYVKIKVGKEIVSSAGHSVGQMSQVLLEIATDTVAADGWVSVQSAVCVAADDQDARWKVVIEVQGNEDSSEISLDDFGIMLVQIISSLRITRIFTF